MALVRHEVACVFIKEIIEIRRSATGTLRGRASGVYPEVRSVRDTVASVDATGNQTVRRGCDCQPRGGREPGLKGKANSGESLLSRRY
jgi:hypothetical protein